MRRPFTVLCVLLAFGSGLYLYRAKYASQLLDREIAVTLKAADDARARAGMLRADYALLNDPIRLQELADQHLGIKTTQPGQFTTLAELERRLPAVGAPVEVAAEPDVPVAVRRPEPEVARPVEAPRPAPVVAAAVPRAVAPAPMVPPVAAPPASAPMVMAAAAPRVMPAPLPAGGPRAPTPLAPPLPGLATQAAIGAAMGPVSQAVIRAAPPVSAPAVAAPAARPVPPRIVAAPVSAPGPGPSAEPPAAPRSALGMARRPLVPLSAASANGGGTN